MIIAYVMFWYLLHQRELKRFYEQQNAVSKEIKAVKKETEVTNVLNLQKNAVIIFSQSNDSEIESSADAQLQETPTIEFANFTSSNLFKIKLDDLNDLTKLKLHQFVPLKKSEAELYENEPPAREWYLNALRARIDTVNYLTTNTDDLFSLKQIMLMDE